MPLRPCTIPFFVALALVSSACGDSEIDHVASAEVDSSVAGIVGGWAATEDQIFATVEIRRTGAQVGFCSGALIAPKLVVTAAHCVVTENNEGGFTTIEPRDISVGSGYLSGRSVAEKLIRRVNQIRAHEAYDHDFVMGSARDGAGAGGMGSPHDIALLVLKEPFDDTPNAPLLSAAQASEMIELGDIGFVAGYGVFDLDENLSGELHITDAIIDRLGDRELLTRRADPFGDSCFGDSGGPLYLPKDNGNYLIGLVSRGRSDVGRDCGDGGIYTLISSYLPWIRQQAGEHFDPQLAPEQQGFSFRAAGAHAIKAPEAQEVTEGCAVSSGASPSVWANIAAWVLAIGLLLRRRKRI